MSIKLLTSERTTKRGHPIYIYLSHKDIRKRRVVGYSWPHYWDPQNKLPLKAHPDYNLLLPEILDLKAKIKRIEFGKLPLEMALNILFKKNEEPQSDGFYEACSRYFDHTKNGILYKTVCNSFAIQYPGIRIQNITKSKVRAYMEVLLQHQKPNGVHTYLRTLNALFNKISSLDNPFKGVRPKRQPTPSKALSENDLKKLINTRTIVGKYDGKNTSESINYYRYYWMLMFYLGGIDMVDLANLRYDTHVFGDRIQFSRFKGSSDVFINNRIFPNCAAILKQFDCWPYLVPIYQQKDYNSFVSNFNNRFSKSVADLSLTRRPLTKSARYSFITRAQQLLIDERIAVEIVGHTQQSIHSIYTDQFPIEVRDAAHLKIISI